MASKVQTMVCAHHSIVECRGVHLHRRLELLHRLVEYCLVVLRVELDCHLEISHREAEGWEKWQGESTEMACNGMGESTEK